MSALTKAAAPKTGQEYVVVLPPFILTPKPYTPKPLILYLAVLAPRPACGRWLRANLLIGIQQGVLKETGLDLCFLNAVVHPTILALIRSSVAIYGCAHHCFLDALVTLMRELVLPVLLSFRLLHYTMSVP